VGFEVGQRFADHEIVSLLGAGGMGRVYRVRNVISNRTEAMKVLLADLNAEPDLAARFLGEIRTLARLVHPNIAQLHTAMQVGNEMVMMMEFVEGSTLQQLAQQAPLPAEKVIGYIQQVLAALSFAHSHGVVHRDIKPANIMVTPQGKVKLTDFGIAKSKTKDDLTRPGTTVGSLYYMSPEQAVGGSAADGRSDIYSVGITLYELLAGRLPFEDESAYVVLHSQLNAVPVPPIEVNPFLPKPLSDLILRALEKDPAQRFQSAAEVSDALCRITGVAASTPIERAAFILPAAAPASVAASPRSIAGRRRFWIAADSFAVVAILAAVVGLPHFSKASPGGTAGDSSLVAARYVGIASTQDRSKTTRIVDAAKTLDKAPAVATAMSPAISPAVSPAQSLPAATHDGATTEQARMPKGDKAPAPAVAGPSSPKVAGAGYLPPSLPGPMVNADDARALTVAKLAEVQEVRTQMAELDARAGAVRISVQRLKSQQEAAGDGLSQDVAGAYVRMNTYLSAEKMDLKDGDVTAARDHMDKAKLEVNMLEKMFAK
jgi:eukaryotic-like serine/threonine-protein kinase